MSIIDSNFMENFKFGGKSLIEAIHHRKLLSIQLLSHAQVTHTIN